jgi:hypothetical protein
MSQLEVPMPRGRKSPDALQLVPQVPWSPPEPPAEFDAVEAAHWCSIVGSMPSSWLTGAAKPLLARLCVVITTCELLERDLRRMWAAGPMDAKLLSAHAAACTTLAKLAQSLRISPRSRWTAKSAAEQVREAKTAARPWELRAAGPWDD